MRLGEQNARIARAGGIEIRPRLLAAFGTQRTDIGAIALGADDRRAAPTCGDKLGKATNKDAAIAETAISAWYKISFCAMRATAVGS